MKNKILILASLPLLALSVISVANKTKNDNTPVQQLEAPILAVEKKEATYQSGTTYYDIPLAENAKTVNNGPYYFERLGTRHGLNNGSTNGYVAIQIWLGWMDASDDSVVPEQYDVPAEECINPSAFYTYEPQGFSVSPGTDDYNLGRNSFYEYLASQYGHNIFNYSTSLNMKQVKNVIKRYLDDQNRTYSIEHSEGNYNDNKGDKAYKILTRTVDAGFPCICKFNDRYVVVYA